LFRVNINRDTAAVILNADPVIRLDVDGNNRSVASHGFVKTVVYDFPNKVVKTLGAG
jgi:hypothetical protein